MVQRWLRPLFAHWPVAPDVLRPLIPPGLALDLYDGQAWVGVVPFAVTGLRPRGLPPLPPTAQFLELNVRTYVTAEGKPGVWFFSLDASSRLAVEGARLGFGLPYFHADMLAGVDGDRVHYSSRRTDPRIDPGDFEATYRPVSDVFTAAPGSLDAWLTERYCLYTLFMGQLWRVNILHPPWMLRRAEADLWRNTVTEAHGISLPDAPPLLHLAEPQDVLVWFLERVKGSSRNLTP